MHLSPGSAALHVPTWAQGYQPQPRLHSCAEQCSSWHTSWQGLDKRHSNTAAWPHQQLDPLAELKGVLALTGMKQELEQEAAEAPAPASAPAPFLRQHHVQTVVGRMWDILIIARCSSTHAAASGQSAQQGRRGSGQDPSQPPEWVNTCKVLGCGGATSSTVVWQHSQSQAMFVAKHSCTFPTSRLSAVRDAQPHCCGENCAGSLCPSIPSTSD